MSPTNQTMLARFAVATSVFSLLMVAFVAARGSSDGSGQSVASGPVPVQLSEFAISPATVTVPVGGSLSLTNTGSMVHNVGVTDTPIISADLQGGGSGSLDLSSLAPGTYELFCAIAGHKDSGMTATLVVTDSGGGGGDAAAGTHAGHTDIASLEAGSDHANRINQEMEEAMTQGVQDFLAFGDKYAAGEMEAGNERIEPTILDDGTKQFELTAEITEWQVSPGKVVQAWTYNGRVPGPWIRVEPGDKVEVVLHNKLPISTDIHWHGIDVPFDQDGVAPITQDYIRPLETYTYRWTAPDYPMLGMYHAHMHGHEAIINGLFAGVQVGDMELPRGQNIAGLEVPADVEISQEIPMVLNDAGVIGLSLNGKAFPETEPIVANEGDWILMHFYNEGLAGHPMHLHRQPHAVVAKDGFPLSAPYRADTIWVSPGERYSILIKAELAGIWAFHCHVVTHAEDANGLMGMVTAMIVNEAEAPASPDTPAAG